MSLLGRPEVIVKEINGVKCEPYELLVIDAPDDTTGTVIEKLGKRKAEMVSMNPTGDGQTRIEFEIPARGLIGFRSQFLTDTKGEGVMNHSFWSFRPLAAPSSTEQRRASSMENGVTLAYSLFNLQDRGVLFLDPQAKVYVGMIIGEHSRPKRPLM